jgi:hypothetical protein
MFYRHPLDPPQKFPWFEYLLIIAPFILAGIGIAKYGSIDLAVIGGLWFPVVVIHRTVALKGREEAEVAAGAWRVYRRSWHRSVVGWLSVLQGLFFLALATGVETPLAILLVGGSLGFIFGSIFHFTMPYIALTQERVNVLYKSFKFTEINALVFQYEKIRLYKNTSYIEFEVKYLDNAEQSLLLDDLYEKKLAFGWKDKKQAD